MSATLYGHYTTPAGLKGIVESETVWATNIKFLNDEQEFQHALDLIRAIILDHKRKVHRSNDPTFNEYVLGVENKLASLDNSDADTVFTLSFSEQTDLLSQWRGYCPGNNGYCIVFDAEQLAASVRGYSKDRCELVKCVYDDTEKERQIKELLNRNWPAYHKQSGHKAKRDVIHDLAKNIILLASYFKHHSFKEEQEHRIVVLRPWGSPSDVMFREGRSSLVPYIVLPAKRELITRICIGPNPTKLLAKRALEAFLSKVGMDTTFGPSPVEISFSEAPYRHW